MSTQQDLHTQIALELQRSNPDQYAEILQRIGHKEPQLYDTAQMPSIRDRFLTFVGLEQSAFLQRRWNRSVHQYRRILLAVLLELYAPNILSVPHQSRAPIAPKLSRPICMVVGFDPRVFCRSVAEVRFFYQTYPKFREQVASFLDRMDK